MKDNDKDYEDNDSKDDKTITAVGILSTIDSILNVMEEKAEVIFEFKRVHEYFENLYFYLKLQILNSLEQIVLPVIYAIAQSGMMGK